MNAAVLVLAGAGLLAVPSTVRTEAVASPPATSGGGWPLLAVLALVAGDAGGPVVALAAVIVGGAAWLLIRSAAVTRRASAERRATLVAVRRLVTELEVGSRPADALAAAAELDGTAASAWQRAAVAAADGRDPAAELEESRPAMAAAWRVAATTGAPLAAVLARVAGDVAAAEDQQRRVHGEAAGARSSAALLAALPLLGLGLGAATGGHPGGELLTTPLGHALALAGATLDAAGVVWADRLLRRATGGGRPP